MKTRIFFLMGLLTGTQTSAVTLTDGPMPGAFEHHGPAIQACLEMGFRADLQLPSLINESYNVIVDEPDWSRVSAGSRTHASGPLLATTLSSSDTTATSFSCTFATEDTGEHASQAWASLSEALSSAAEDGSVTTRDLWVEDGYVGLEYCVDVTVQEAPMVAIVGIAHERVSEAAIASTITMSIDAAGGDTQICWVDGG